MKSSYSNSNDILHLYPNRNFVSLSSKLATNPYVKPTTYNFNSPKNDPQKNIIFSTRNQSDPNKYVKKTEKLESTLERKNSRSNEGTTPKAGQMSNTLNSFGTSPRYGFKKQPVDDKRNSVEKLKNPAQDVYTSSNKYSAPKVTESMNLRDTLKGDNSLNRSKNLEISTDFATSKLAAPTPKAQTTKSKDVSDKIPQNEAYKKNVVSQYSFEFNSKFSSKLNGGTSSTNNTEPNEDKAHGLHPSSTSKTQTSLNNRYAYQNEKVSTGYEKSYSQDRQTPTNQAAQKKYQAYQTSEMNYPSTTTNKSSSVKVNNFFNNNHQAYEPTKTEKEKILNKTQKVDYELYDNEDIITKSTELTKKIFSKTQQDLKQTLRGISAEPSNQKKESDSRNPQKENIQTSQKQEVPATKPQQPNINSFITKVNRGEIFSTATATKPQQLDESPKKTFGGVEDKLASKTPKSSSNLVSKSLVGPKTTTNQDAKSFTFTNASATQNSSSTNISQTPKNSQTSSQDAKQNMYQQNQQSQQMQRSSTSSVTKVNTKPQTPTGRSRDEIVSTSSSQVVPEKKSFVYYMTGIEKYHKSYIESDYFCQIYREHFMQTYQAMMFCRYLKNVDPKVLAQKRVFLSKRESHKDKKTLVFDLDETLIHCNESVDLPCDVKLPIRFPHGEIIEAGINIRPYVHECLKELSQHFELIVFTASHGCYANVVLDYLDPKEQYIHHRLFRESCVTTDEGIYIKDLRVLANRNLQDVVIVDNAAYSFGYQIENGIPIIPFYDNKTDVELKHLVPYAKYLASVKDLREVNKQTFRLHTYSMYDTPDKVLDKVIFQK